MVMRRSMNKIALTIVILALTALAGLVGSRWALAPLGFHTIVGPAHTGDTELIRECWPHRLVQPEWVSSTPDTYMNWSLTEAMVRLGIVAAVWLSTTTGLVIRHRRRSKRPHNPAAPDNGGTTSRLPFRKPWAARIAQLRRSTASHHMRTCYIIICLISSLGGASGQIKETFKYRGHWYQLAVKFEVMRDLPFWDCEKQENPPVSASRAVKEAFKFMSKLEHQSGWDYHLDLRLKQPASNWIWEARWRRYRDVDGRRESDEETRCWILMDGTVVEPVLVNNPKANVGP